MEMWSSQTLASQQDPVHNARRKILRDGLNLHSPENMERVLGLAIKASVLESYYFAEEFKSSHYEAHPSSGMT